MPDGWNVYKGSWTERYFNPQVAVFDGGIPPESIVNFVGEVGFVQNSPSKDISRAS